MPGCNDLYLKREACEVPDGEVLCLPLAQGGVHDRFDCSLPTSARASGTHLHDARPGDVVDYCPCSGARFSSVEPHGQLGMQVPRSLVRRGRDVDVLECGRLSRPVLGGRLHQLGRRSHLPGPKVWQLGCSRRGGMELRTYDQWRPALRLRQLWAESLDVTELAQAVTLLA